MDKHTILKHYFGHSEFRPGQETMIDALLAGRDALGIMSTGAGKSMCYQVTALLLEGVTLVISPLISLMKDQVAALKAAGIPSAYLNSSLTPRQLELATERAAQGAYRIIYVAPERLETASFRRFAQSTRISLVAVDEAHCVSQWGQDFRPNYLRIADFIDSLPVRPPVGAFTATATEQVRRDVVRLLRLRSPATVTTGFDRPNLYFEVVQPKSKYEALRRILHRNRGKSGIVYCNARKTVEDVCDKLVAEGVNASRYHAGLSEEERALNQEDFQYDRVTVMVATNAFGMGIDKSNVSFVIHYNMPRSMEAYYQEAGRAGRDGSDAECILLFSPQDIMTAKWLMNNSEPNAELTDAERAAVRKRDYQRLYQMADYCQSAACLRGYILRYFGQRAQESCGACCRCSGYRYPDLNGLERVKGMLHRASRAAAPATEPGLQVSAYEDGAPLMPLKPGVRLGHAQAASGDAGEVGDPLFEELRACRMELSKALRVPPYVIASDKTLSDMARRKPRTTDAMLDVYGMGTAKVGKYGEAFLGVIRAYLKEHGQAEPPSGRAQTKKAPARAAEAGAWSHEEEERLRRGYLAGVSISQLAAIHGRSEAQVRSRLKKLHLIFDPGRVERYGVSAYMTEDGDDD